MLVSQHDARIADLDLGMVDPAAGTIQPQHILGAECRLVKANRLAGAADIRYRVTL
jgi:hypothetical protein